MEIIPASRLKLQILGLGMENSHTVSVHCFLILNLSNIYYERFLTVLIWFAQADNHLLNFSIMSNRVWPFMITRGG